MEHEKKIAIFSLIIAHTGAFILGAVATYLFMDIRAYIVKLEPVHVRQREYWGDRSIVDYSKMQSKVDYAMMKCTE